MSRGPSWLTAAGRSTGLGMAAGTSPAVADTAAGPEYAFEANTGALWTADANGNGTPGTFDLAGGSSPAIHAL